MIDAMTQTDWGFICIILLAASQVFHYLSHLVADRKKP